MTLHSELHDVTEAEYRVARELANKMIDSIQPGGAKTALGPYLVASGMVICSLVRAAHLSRHDTELLLHDLIAQVIGNVFDPTNERSH